MKESIVTGNAPPQYVARVRELSKLATKGFRPYQAHSSWHGLTWLTKAGVILTLPQGTGKSFVSQLIAHEYLRRHPGNKVLIVAPTKELREQYVRMAEWMGHVIPRIAVLDFREPICDSQKQVRLMVEQAQMIVTTPEMFTNRLQWVTRESFTKIQMCVLDEVDLWLIDDFTNPDTNRYHAALTRLKSRLKNQGTRFLGLTASTLSKRGKELLVDDLKCQPVTPFHKSIVRWLPKVQIEPVACFDKNIIAQDESISKKSSMLVRQINDKTSGALDRLQTDFWLFIKSVASGRWGAEAAALALALLANERSRVQLFEDGVIGKVKIQKIGTLIPKSLPAIVYCREIKLVEQLATEPWAEQPAVAHSGLGDRYLLETLRFKNGSRRLLLMTRDLGKRGLDFPMAKILVLVSPKSSERTMDQELCRTRGQRRDTKPKQVFVLFYQATYEEEKMMRVLKELIQLKMYGKFSKFVLSKRSVKWLNNRKPLSIREYLALR